MCVIGELVLHGGEGDGEPNDPRDDGQDDDSGHKVVGDLVSKALDGSFRTLSVLDQFHNLVKRAVLGCFCHFDDDVALEQGGATVHSGANRFEHVSGLTSEHALIASALAEDDDAVNWNLSSDLDRDQVVDL